MLKKSRLTWHMKEKDLEEEECMLDILGEASGEGASRETTMKEENKEENTQEEGNSEARDGLAEKGDLAEMADSAGRGMSAAGLKGREDIKNSLSLLLLKSSSLF